MRPTTTVVCGLLFATHLLYTGAASAAGTVILRDIDNGICSLAVPGPGERKIYHLGGDNPHACAWFNDKAVTIQLAEVPSATVIMLTNDSECSSGPTLGPWYQLLTNQKKTNTSIISIEYIGTFENNNVVEPGLKLIKKQTSAEPNRDFVSCVSIQTSAAPPKASKAP